MFRMCRATLTSVWIVAEFLLDMYPSSSDVCDQRPACGMADAAASKEVPPLPIWKVDIPVVLSRRMLRRAALTARETAEPPTERTDPRPMDERREEPRLSGVTSGSNSASTVAYSWSAICPKALLKSTRFAASIDFIPVVIR